MMRKLFTNQSGDTIVEVLIAMAVASLVLGSSYAVANRTMANTRQAQEHSEATEIANEQIEAIASLSGAGNTDISDNTPVYNCISIVGINMVVVPQFTLSNPLDETSDYQPACVRTSAAGYRTAFRYIPLTRTYEVTVTWDAIATGNQSKVSLTYKANAP